MEETLEPSVGKRKEEEGEKGREALRDEMLQGKISRMDGECEKEKSW